MVKRIIFIFILGLLLIQVILALDTPITVKTKANYDVTIRILNPDTTIEFESFEKKSDSNGEASVVFSQDIGKIAIFILVRKDGKLIINREFNNYSTGKSIILDLEKKPETQSNETINQTVLTNLTNISINETLATNLTNVTENTINETENLENNESSEKNITEQIEIINQNKTSKISGMIINGTKKVILSKITYIIVGIGFVLFLLIFILRKKLKERNHFDFRVKHMEAGEKIKFNEDKKIIELERKILDAKKELDYIKDRKRRVTEIEERLKKDHEELRKLKTEF